MMHHTPRHGRALLAAACLVASLLAACGGDSTSGGGATSGADRAVRFNGRQLSESGRDTLTRLESQGRFRLPDGDYWYDPACGAAGRRGGPCLGFLPPGLELGGRLPADASGRGQTSVFVNGRELHPTDLAQLQLLTGPLAAGRYFVDARGNAGQEGGPPLVNLLMIARQRGGGGAWGHSQGSGGSRNHVGGDGSGFSYFISSDGTSWSSGF